MLAGAAISRSLITEPVGNQKDARGV